MGLEKWQQESQGTLVPHSWQQEMGRALSGWMATLLEEMSRALPGGWRCSRGAGGQRAQRLSARRDPRRPTAPGVAQRWKVRRVGKPLAKSSGLCTGEKQVSRREGSREGPKG